ncbi:hypothetical protein NL676_024595 [Syzygium grande]|nr:hypothetical protein NL676_024595 [Syzygium grande]
MYEMVKEFLSSTEICPVNVLPIPLAHLHEVHRWSGKMSVQGRIELSTHHITGPVPSSLVNLTDLVYLFFYENQLSGLIPGSLEDLMNLEAVGGLGNPAKSPDFAAQAPLQGHAGAALDLGSLVDRSTVGAPAG